MVCPRPQVDNGLEGKGGSNVKGRADAKLNYSVIAMTSTRKVGHGKHSCVYLTTGTRARCFSYSSRLPSSFLDGM